MKGKALLCADQHDRAFLRADRARPQDRPWPDHGASWVGFEEWRETVGPRKRARHKLDRKIKAEAKWVVEASRPGASAISRVRIGGTARNAVFQISPHRAPHSSSSTGQQSGKRVIEAKGISKIYGDKTIVQH